MNLTMAPGRSSLACVRSGPANQGTAASRDRDGRLLKKRHLETAQSGLETQQSPQAAQWRARMNLKRPRTPGELGCLLSRNLGYLDLKGILSTETQGINNIERQSLVELRTAL